MENLDYLEIVDICKNCGIYAIEMNGNEENCEICEKEEKGTKVPFSERAKALDESEAKASWGEENPTPAWSKIKKQGGKMSNKKDVRNQICKSCGIISDWVFFKKNKEGFCYECENGRKPILMTKELWNKILKEKK